MKVIYFSVLFMTLGLTSFAWLPGSPDPSDDFSYFLGRSVQGATTNYTPSSAQTMSKDVIATLFADHLDLFPKSKTSSLAQHLLQLCKQYEFDPAFILSMVQVESGYRIRIKSAAGAIGLMQLMPATAEAVAKKYGIRYTGAKSLEDPFTNLSVGVAYLSMLRQRYVGHSPYYHIAAYNIGPYKLDALRSNPGFTPKNTKIYYNKIRKGVPQMRFYKGLVGV